MIYETHVRGFTQLHPEVREELRGTYAGLASEPSLAYLRDLGVTAVELLPVHHIVDESFLFERGLSNYWGYSTIGFFAPHSGYAATGQHGQEVREFKGMVKALHRAGIEVILDVVYNHTAEGNHLGPMLSFKGVDNKSYYRLVPDDVRHYMDYTGTGNTLNAQHPSVLRLIMDSLRYWVTECHVDGFRFDLASALARELYDVDRLSAFFDVIHQDPVLSQVKLIAEPWDVGPGGYQVGNFPVLWSEWNGIYRDLMRDFWRGQASVGDFASRLTGSSDLYEDDGRHPFASINFITAHDGFTLRDLVSYNDKHNEANLEDNRDGTDDNRSWNCGVEGETDDPEINELRARQQRNFLATLILSQGTPMLLGGDEFGRTQHGTNNAWCQDNEISWFDWTLLEEHAELHEFVKKLIVLRRAHPVFRRRQFLRGHRRGRHRPARRLVVPHRRAPDDQERLGVRASGRSACSSTARRSPRRTRRASGSSTSRSCCCSTPTTRTSPSRCRTAASVSAGRWCSRPPTPRPSRTRSRSTRSRTSWSAGARWSCCGGDDRAARHLPPPAGRRLRLRRGARAGAVPRRSRRLAPVPAAVVPGAAGIDARLRRRRSDRRLGGTRRGGRVPRARLRPRTTPGSA